jgi:hypothetical protein
MIETLMVKKLHFRPSWFLRFIVRDVYVGKQNPLFIKYCMPKNQVTSSMCFVISAFTMFVAITFPFFRWSARIFWRICICANNIFCKANPPLENKNNATYTLILLILYFLMWHSHSLREWSATYERG